MTKSPEIDLILFDLGGVLVELGEYPFPPEWLNENSRFRLSEWFLSPTATAFETGEISAVEFARSLKSELGLTANEDEIIAQFARWPVGVFPLAEQLLVKLQGSCPLAVLTNSNDIHWPRVLGEFDLPQFFTHMYSSHLIHLAKPDPRAFAYVLADLNIKAQKVLFFDDNPANVASGEEVGLFSVQVSGPEAVEMYLVSNSMIDP